MDNTRKVNICVKLLSVIIVLLTIVTGSRISNLYSLQNCDIPKRQYDIDNLMRHNLVMYKDHGRKVINFSMHVPLKTPPVAISLHGYHVRKIAKIPEIYVGNITCRNILVGGLLRLIKLKYSKEQCRAYPGNYSFHRIPASDIVRLWQFSRSRIGKYIFEFEFFTEKGVVICFGATVEIK